MPTGENQPRRNTSENFWNRVAKGAPDECWPWTGRPINGYGHRGQYLPHSTWTSRVPFVRPYSTIASVRMTSILGLDISSVRLDAALLVPGQPPVLRHEVLGKSSEPLIERLRAVQISLYRLFSGAPHDAPLQDLVCYPPIDWLVIEDSYGAFRNAVRALDKITGAIIASCPQETQVMLLSTHDWRTAIGCEKNTKEAGHDEVRLTFALDEPTWVESLDEHQLDALGIALGARKILMAQADA